MKTTDVICRFLLTMVVIVSFLVVGSLLKNKQLFDTFLNMKYEDWSDYGMYLAHPSRNFSGESEVPLDQRIFQQPTKCFSCERELRNMYGLNPNMIYMANPTKCFSCERQFLENKNKNIVENFTNVEDAFDDINQFPSNSDFHRNE